MAVSAVDLRILGALAEDTQSNNALLASCLYQILGLSVILSQQLTKARSQRRLDYTRETKSLKLYHHIIWLAREGLSITEIFILPYCQNGDQGPEYRVMAAKMRASFYHIFCLFHNHPPVFQIQPTNSSVSIASTPKLSSDGNRLAQLQQNTPGLRDSLISESSYVTNPFAPPNSPPPRYPIPPLPTTPSRRTPLRPPGFSPKQHSPPSSATYLLPPLNFVPSTTNYFMLASSLARKLLSGAHPLRLSVAHEFTAFLSDCAKDSSTARQVAADAVKAAYSDESDLSDKEWEDIIIMVKALTVIAKRNSDQGSSSSSKGTNKTSPPPSKPPVPRPLPTPPTSTIASLSAAPLNVPPRSGDGVSTPRSATLVNSPSTGVFDPENKQIEKFKMDTNDAARKSQTSSRSSRRGKQEGGGTEKERKRRAVEKAELDLSRKNSAVSSRVSERSSLTARRI